MNNSFTIPRTLSLIIAGFFINGSIKPPSLQHDCRIHFLQQQEDEEEFDPKAARSFSNFAAARSRRRDA
jgi:hypothetical protein